MTEAFEPEFVDLEDVVPPEDIARIDERRRLLYGLVSRRSEENVFALLSNIDYGPDRVVPLRDRDSSVKKQVGPRCTAWGVVGAMENRINHALDLSEWDLWRKYGIANLERAMSAAASNWIRTEEEEVQHQPGTIRIGEIAYLRDDFRLVMAALDHGVACTVGLQVPKQMSQWLPQIEEDSPMTRGGHALCVSGYKIENRRPYFLVKNSWGTQCGDLGYQWVSYHLYVAKGYVAFYAVNSIVKNEAQISVREFVPEPRGGADAATAHTRG
jgi:hypothetical protein